LVPLTIIAAEFQESIGNLIPRTINLLKEDGWDVRAAGAEALSKLSELGMPRIWSGMRLLR
jgi:hypothetical protein